MRFIVLFLAIFIAACGERTLPDAYRTGELVVLTRAGASTYSADATIGESGFDYDLVRLFAEEQGLKTRIIVANDDAELFEQLRNNTSHLAAGGQTPRDDARLKNSLPYFESQSILVTHEASLPLSEIDQLAQKTVHVLAGSRQETSLREIGKKIPTLIIISERDKSELDLMENVASRKIDAALIDRAEFAIGDNFYPELQGTLKIGPTLPVVWLFAPGAPPRLVEEANAFLRRMQDNGELNHLKDRYFGHIERLSQADIVRFIDEMRSTLPQFRAQFQEAQISTGIDWRLLAALAYQESQWNPLATSRTGVRGMMMLTEDTADRLGVSNRLDPKESILAGARYLADLRDALPPEVAEPDRLWLALAAYNLGLGHLNAARHIAKTQKANPDSWYEMKTVLPLLAKPRFYSHLKSGKGRGGEAVIMAENIRVYNDILYRHESPFHPYERIPEKTTGGLRHPLQFLPIQAHNTVDSRRL